MHNSDVQFLREAFKRSIIERGFDAESQGLYYESGSIDIEELTEKILALPDHMKELLFAKHIWKLDPHTTENVLSCDCAIQKLRYAEGLLAYSLRLPENYRIAGCCMEQALEPALLEYIKELDTNIVIRRPRYSNGFRKTLKEIKAAQRYNNHISLKRAGIAVAAAVIGFAMTLTVSAQIRNKFFNWIIETFPLYSKFNSVGFIDSDELDFEMLKNLQINYIPDGFTLAVTLEENPIIIYRYESQPGKTLSITAKLPTDSSAFFDTEGDRINEIIFNNQPAYWWESNGRYYLIWQQDGFEFNVFGNINYDDAIKIAENIQISKN